MRGLEITKLYLVGGPPYLDPGLRLTQWVTSDEHSREQDRVAIYSILLSECS